MDHLPHAERTPEMGKVAFHLAQDEDGYPPAEWEHLWGRRVGDSLYALDNTPFFARGVSFGDVVLVENRDGLNVFLEVVRPSGHSTIRVILFDQAHAQDIRKRLRDLACASELSHIPGLIAVDVPPTADLASVRRLLNSGEQSGQWEYEEAAVR